MLGTILVCAAVMVLSYLGSVLLTPRPGGPESDALSRDQP